MLEWHYFYFLKFKVLFHSEKGNFLTAIFEQRIIYYKLITDTNFRLPVRKYLPQSTYTDQLFPSAFYDRD